MTAKKLLLIIEDTALRDSLDEQLRLTKEFAVVEKDLDYLQLQNFKISDFDIAILESNENYLNYIKFIKLYRELSNKFPIIIIFAGEIDVSPNLNLAETLLKPFRFSTLLTMIRSKIRRYEESKNSVFVMGPYTVNTSSKFLSHNEKSKTIRLTEKEVSILKYLYKANGRIVYRKILLNEIWGYNSEVTTHTVETHIYRLRQKIEKAPTSARILVTSDGGYKLVL